MKIKLSVLDYRNANKISLKGIKTKEGYKKMLDELIFSEACFTYEVNEDVSKEFLLEHLDPLNLLDTYEKFKNVLKRLKKETQDLKEAEEEIEEIEAVSIKSK